LVHLGLGEAKLIGKHAKELFSMPDFSGRVLAVVSNAVYLTSVIARNGFCDAIIPHAPFGDRFASLAITNPEILWLAQDKVPMHTRALRGDFDFSTLRVGMRFRSDGASLQFDVGMQGLAFLQFADACVWQPTTFAPARVAPRATVVARVRGLGVTDFKPIKSLDDTRALIGLGEGLTPSGDDFVGGLLFVVHHLRAAYPGAFRWERRAIDDLLEYARGRTNDISYALLRDHAEGESVELLHDCLAALLGVDERADLASLVARLIGVGSTTGKNIWAGAATGTLLLAADGR
jgi:hypothetical protein